MNSQRKWESALHESAHAVIFRLVGHEILEIDMDIDLPEYHSRGACVRTARRPIFEEDLHGVLAAEVYLRERDIPFTDRSVHGDRELADSMFDHDQQKIAEDQLKILFQNPDIEHAIQTLATTLVDVKVIDGDTVHAIIDPFLVNVNVPGAPRSNKRPDQPVRLHRH